MMTSSASRPSGKPANQLLVVAILLAQVGFGLLAMTMCLPSMPEWRVLFAVDQASVQLTFSGYVFAFAFCQLFYGPLSDRHGRKQVLMSGMLLACIGSLLAAWAPNLTALVAARMLQGAGAAAGMVVGRAMVQDLFTGPERTRIMAFIGMAMGSCPPLAMLLGGQVHVSLGWQANFYLTAVIAVLLLLASWQGLPTVAPSAATGNHWLHDMWLSYLRLAREPVFWLYVVVVAMTTATFYAFLGGAPIVLRSYGVGPERVGWYIMFVSGAYVLGNFLTSHWIRVVGANRLMLIGQALTVGGLLLMLALALAGFKTALAFGAPLMLLGLGHGLYIPAALSGIVGVVPAIAGAAAAVAGSSQQAMGAIGGYVVGLLSHDGALNLGLLMLGFSLCGAGAQMLLRRR